MGSESSPLNRPARVSSSLFVCVQDDADAPLTKGKNKEQEEGAGFAWRGEVRAQFALLWPIVLSSVLEYVPAVTGIVLVGHLPEDPSDPGVTQRYMDAAALSNMFSGLTCLSIGIGMTSAMDTLASQAFGAGYYMKLGIYLQAGLLVLGACMLPMIAVNWFAGDILRVFGQDPEVSRLAGEFSRITVFGMPFLVFYELMRKLLQAQNVVRPMIMIAIFSDLVHIGIGYYLTFHTSLGFHGAALSRVIGYAVLPIGWMVYVWRSRSYRTWWPGWDMQSAKHQVMPFLHLGVPGMLMLMMEWWAADALALLAGLLPDHLVAISTHAVLLSFSSVIFMVYVGVSSAGCIRIGNLLGAGMFKRARFAGIIALVIVVASACTMAAFALGFRSTIPALFVNDPSTISYTAHLMLLAVAMSIVDGINCVMQGICRGIGWQRIAVWSNAIGYYAVGIPSSLIGAFVLHWGLAGLWAGYLIGTATNVLILSFVLARADWHQLAIEAQERTAE